MDVPLQIRQNALEYQDILKDLNKWERSMRDQERQQRAERTVSEFEGELKGGIEGES